MARQNTNPGQSPAARDTGEGVIEINPQRTQGPDEVTPAPVPGDKEPEIDKSATPDNVPDPGPSPIDQAEDAGGETGPQNEAELKLQQERAEAAAKEAVQVAAYDLQVQEERLGSPDKVDNSSAWALQAELNQMGVDPQKQRLLAAQPDAYEVTRAQGVAVYVPVNPTDETSEDFRHVAVPYRSPLPEGTTAEQLGYLLTLGYVAAKPSGA